MREFFNMGGYAFYVWTAYAIVIFTLVINAIIAINKRRKTIDTLKKELGNGLE